MASRDALAAATDLDAVLVAPWAQPLWLVRVRVPAVVVLAAAVALVPLSLSGDVPGLTIVVGAVLAAGTVGIFLVVMKVRSGSRLIGYSARGVFAPDLQPWDRVARIHTTASSSGGRVISIEAADGIRHDVAISSAVTEPEYRAFLAALVSEAQARGIPAVR